MPQDTPSRHKDQFVLRLPDGMRDRIAEEAKAGGRSMNAQIVLMLENAFSEKADVLASIEAIHADIEKLSRFVETSVRKATKS